MMKFDDGSGRVAKFKNRFFKGRIEKTIKREKHISLLSKEYNEGKILKVE